MTRTARDRPDQYKKELSRVIFYLILIALMFWAGMSVEAWR